MKALRIISVVTILGRSSSFQLQPILLQRSRASDITKNVVGVDMNQIVLPRKSNSQSGIHRVSCDALRDSRRNFTSSSSLMSHNSDESDVGDIMKTRTTSIAIFGSVAFLYWYLLVFGAAAEANGLPMPTFIPLIPGWPPSDQDLVPVIEDSIHFFYISDFLNSLHGNADVQTSTINLPQLRLAFFNLAEAWVFAFLPLLLEDKKRLPLPVVIGTWLGALGLTNAFLTPYLAARQLFHVENSESTISDDENDAKSNKNKPLKLIFGLIASLVVGNAGYETVLTTLTNPNEWGDFLSLIKQDRTYLAFAVDLVLFSFIQSYLLGEIDESNNRANKVPFLGLIFWLFREK